MVLCSREEALQGPLGEALHPFAPGGTPLQATASPPQPGRGAFPPQGRGAGSARTRGRPHLRPNTATTSTHDPLGTTTSPTTAALCQGPGEDPGGGPFSPTTSLGGGPLSAPTSPGGGPFSPPTSRGAQPRLRPL